MAAAYEEIRLEYLASLNELHINSKPLINNMTMIAQDNSHAFTAIIDAIETRIRTAPPSELLPVLYLVDSICKNVGDVYLEAFTRLLPRMFQYVYESVPANVHPALRRLAGTWHFVFPRHMVDDVEAFIRSTEQPPPPLPMPFPPPQLAPSHQPIVPMQASAVRRFPPEKPVSFYYEEPIHPVPQLLPLPPPRIHTPPTHMVVLPPPLPPPPAVLPPQLPLPQPQVHMPAPSTYGLLPLSALTLTNDALKQRYAGSVESLYDNLPKSCSNCGFRFPDTSKGAQSLEEHLNWHFRRNKREREKAKKTISRDWYLPAPMWVTPGGADIMGDEREPVLMSSTAVGSTVAPGDTPAPRSVVPVKDSAGVDYSDVCRVCNERIERAYDNELDEWMFQDAVRIQGVVFHAACQADASKVLATKQPITSVDMLVEPASKRIKAESTW